MYKKKLDKFKRLDRRKQSVVAGSVLLAIILVILLITNLSQPERSVTAYCKIYRQGITTLGHAGGEKYTYSTSVFPDASSNNPGDFIPTFDKLDSVAPTEIEPQVKAMRDTFTKMKDNPTQVVSLAFNGSPAEDAVTQWTQQHCNN
jgi:hypothetical protein